MEARSNVIARRRQLEQELKMELEVAKGFNKFKRYGNHKNYMGRLGKHE